MAGKGPGDGATGPGHSLLGPMCDRVKTDVRLPFALSHSVEELCAALGIPKNALFTLAASLLCVQLAPLLKPGVPRRKMLAELDALFQSVLAGARKSA